MLKILLAIVIEVLLSPTPIPWWEEPLQPDPRILPGVKYRFDPTLDQGDAYPGCLCDCEPGHADLTPPSCDTD